MLVLSRRIGENIFIGDDLEVTVIDADGYYDSVRLTVKSAGATFKQDLGLRGNGMPSFVWLSDVTRLTLLEVREGGRVRLGIDSPRDVKIWRGEIRPSREPTANKNGGRTNGVGGVRAISTPAVRVDQ